MDLNIFTTEKKKQKKNLLNQIKSNLGNFVYMNT